MRSTRHAEHACRSGKSPSSPRDLPHLQLLREMLSKQTLLELEKIRVFKLEALLQKMKSREVSRSHSALLG